MHPTKYIKETKLNTPAAAVYAWHEDPSALDQLTPKEAGIQILKPSALVDGELVFLRVPIVGRWLYVDWVSQICEVQPGLEFTDIQTKGIFRFWRHRHLFIPEGNGCRMRDEIEFLLPGGWLMHRLGKRHVLSKLHQVFTFRHNQLRKAFGVLTEVHQGQRQRHASEPLHSHNPILKYADES